MLQISDTQRYKPVVILHVKAKGKEKKAEVLLDPASYKTHDTGEETSPAIVNYVAKPLAKELIKNDYALRTCNCKPATTCTFTGCFITNECLTMSCTLYDEKATIKDITLAFRIVESLGQNEMIIGLHDVRKHDLTTVFIRIYKIEELNEKSTFLRDRQDLIDGQSQRN